MKAQSIYDKRQNASLVLAYSSLKYNKESVEQENVRAEKYRLDRILADEYVKSFENKEYNKFCLDWIQKNGMDFVTTDKWVYDIEFKEDAYVLNVDNLIDKLHRKRKTYKYN
jgi:hypothetical protein